MTSVARHALDAGFAMDAPWLPRRAAMTPNANALSWPSPVAGSAGSGLRYSELLERVEETALGLRRAGVGIGDVVAVMLASGPEYAVLVHALQLCGAVLLPMNVRLREAELVPQLALVRPRLLLHATGDELALKIARQVGVATAQLDCPGEGPDSPDGRGGMVEVLGGAVAPSLAPLCDRLDAEAPAALLFTSGTTGTPKAAVLSVRAFRASACASAELLGVEEDDEWLACMPLFHVGGLSILARSVLAGTSVRIHSGFDVAVVAGDLEAGRVSQVSLVETMLQRLLDLRGGKRSPERLRTVLLGGGPCATSLLERAIALGYPIAPSYGLTEACSQVATRPPESRERPLHAGLRPLSGVEIQIVDGDGVRLSAGADGEIAVRGDILMSAYFKAPEATRRALQDGWLRTGDVGRLDVNGGLEVLDRREDLIISGGENVVPAEVESVLQGHPSVLEACVVGRSEREFGAVPVAFVVLREGASCEAQTLVAFCREKLAAYKVPVELVLCETLPRTAAGKLQRAVLRERL